MQIYNRITLGNDDYLYVFKFKSVENPQFCKLKMTASRHLADTYVLKINDIVNMLLSLEIIIILC